MPLTGYFAVRLFRGAIKSDNYQRDSYFEIVGNATLEKNSPKSILREQFKLKAGFWSKAPSRDMQLMQTHDAALNKKQINDTVPTAVSGMTYWSFYFL